MPQTAPSRQTPPSSSLPSLPPQGITVPDHITSREQTILCLLVQGWQRKAIAAHLHVSLSVVKWNMEHLREKLDAKNMTHLVVIALKTGLVLVDPPLPSCAGEGAPEIIPQTVGRPQRRPGPGETPAETARPHVLLWDCAADAYSDYVVLCLGEHSRPLPEPDFLRFLSERATCTPTYHLPVICREELPAQVAVWKTSQAPQGGGRHAAA